VKRSIVFSTSAFRPLIPLAQSAEADGFFRLWMTESTARDAIIRAVTLGLHTKRIGVATGIAYAFTRAPLALAAAAADAHIATGGRFTLGLGAGTKGMRSKRYGIEDFDHPASRLGDYVRLIRAVWAANESLSYEGRFYSSDLDSGFPTRELDGLPPLEIVGSGLNPTMLCLAAEYCDGLALHPLVSFLEYLDGIAMPAIQSARRPTGGASPWIAAWRITSISRHRSEARWRARANLAFYFTTPSFQTVTAGTQWERSTALVRERFRENPTLSFVDLAELIPDPMVDDFCLAGTHGHVREQTMELERELGSRGISELVLQTAGVGLDSNQFVEAAHAVITTLAPSQA
jgi:alkanesulfonate monooxygenase SsuD/methylene tetrahydromethanopterin reductase-like flavin-dependent oxidoreductase (luciferase family)